MKKILFLVGVVLLVGLYISTRVTKYPLQEGDLKWSNTKPTDARMCIPAAFTDVDGSVEGSYRLGGKSYQNNRRRKVSLKGDSFLINSRWQSANGFQQLTLVYDSKPKVFSDRRRCMRRGLCKTEDEVFILQSHYPMTMTEFAAECGKRCDYAVYLDMGEFGFGYIKYGRIKVPLHIWGFFTRNKQTNWLYIE